MRYRGDIPACYKCETTVPTILSIDLIKRGRQDGGWAAEHSAERFTLKVQLITELLSPQLITGECQILLKVHMDQLLTQHALFRMRLLAAVCYLICSQVRTLYQSVLSLEMSDLNKWEWFKFKLKQIAIETGKELSQKRKCKQEQFTENINKICNKSEPSVEEKAERRPLSFS